MEEDSQRSSGKGMLVLLTLTLSRISPQTRGLLTNFLLIEIGTTFGTSVGITNQMKTLTSILAFVMALLMGLLSVRIKHRTLLLSGLLLSTLSCIGCYLAPSFIIMVIVFALGGLGVNMIFPMVTALIGQHIPKEGRTNAIAYLMAGNSLLYLVGMPLVNYLGDWRQSFLFFSIPLLLLSLVLSFIFIPKEEITQSSQDVLAGYKGVFSNKSAVACLFAQALGNGAWMITLTLAFSFFREVFLMPRGNVVYLTFGTASTYMLGALSSRRIIPNLGLKRSTMFTLALTGVFSFVYLSGINYVVSLVFVLVVAMLGGVNHSSTQGLSLEQLPELRGSMMSLFAAFGSVGSVVSLSLGGFVLIWFGWGTLGILAVVLCVLGYLVLSLYAIEPK